MTENIVLFWRQLDQLREIAAAGDHSGARKLITEIGASCQIGDTSLDAARQNLLELVSKTFDLGYVRPTPLVAPPLDVPAGNLPGINPEGGAGVSLVTCCMNREENLVRALSSWMACPDISEIIIVDWSSKQLVRTALTEAGITDPRIRVIRVEDEPRWILSYAFNIGFRVASCERILKVDADIVLDPGFFNTNQLEPGHFIAGNWRKAAQNQAYVNGFFYLFKKDVAAIAGFNEFITTYGWDDDDIYDRLERHGVIRGDVDIKTIFHLPHSDEERVGVEEAGADLSGMAELRRDTMHKIRCNRHLAHIMPYWHEGKTLLPFQVLEAGSRDLALRRDGWMPHPVPDHIFADAEYYAALELTSWRLGPRVFGLDRDRLNLLLGKPFTDLNRIDVEIALGNTPETVRAAGRYLVIRVDAKTVPGDSSGGRGFDTLCTLARECGLTPVLTGPFAHLPERATAAALACSFVPEWESLGAMEVVDVAQLRDLSADGSRQNFEITYDLEAIDALTASNLSAPALVVGRQRIFVDGQHGLGNRLRAIGSAAAIAEKSDREMVIVWHPDDHCDCRFSDLFDYDGAVIEESFVDNAAGLGCTVYNYMEIEPGAAKDAKIRLENGDIYARSAYVLNSPLSTWDDENRFLRSLRPVEAVRDMVASVRTPNDISAHVRMEAGAGLDHNTYDSAQNWTEEGHELIHQWRAKSHFSHFITRIDALIKAQEVQTLFIATDLPETYDSFKAHFGARVAYLPRSLYDRSREQLHYALADAILLGQSPRMLGSTWSSFSELAMRMAPQKMKMTIEMSGTDF